MMKNLNRSKLILLLVIQTLFVISVNVIAQSKDKFSSEAERVKYYGIPNLKGARLPEVLPDLSSNYCSTDAPVDIYIDPSNLNPTTTNIVWIIYTGTKIGGDYVEHPGWVSDIGSAPNQGVQFDPSNVPDSYRDIPIVFSYIQNDGTGDIDTNYDYTYVKKTPTVYNFGSNASVCSGSPAVLQLANSELGMEYFLFRGAVQINAVPISGTGAALNFNVYDAGTYTVQARNGDGVGFTCSVTMNGSADVTVNSNPTISTSADVEICNGANTVISATSDMDPDVSYVWDDGISTHNGSTWDVSPTTTTVYTVTGTNDVTGCFNTGTVTVTVNERPSVNLSGTTTICNGDNTNLTFTLTGTAPWNLTYNNGSSDVNVNNILTSPYVASVNPSSTSTYTLVSLSDANLCSSQGADLTGNAIITVNPRPTGVISGLKTICEGESSNITFTLTGSGPWNITYNDGISDYNTTANVSPFNLSVSPTVNTTYTIIGLSDASCIADPSDLSGTATVNVNLRPTGVITGDATICDGESTDLTFNLTGSGPWQITYNDGTSDFIENAVSTPHIVSVSPNLTTVYTITGLTDQLCTSIGSDLSGSATVSVNPRPTAVLSGSTTICDGGSTDLTFNLTGTAPWDLTYNDGTSDINKNVLVSPFVVTVNPATTTTYNIVSLSDATLCSAQAGDMTGAAIVTVNSRPTGVISGSEIICNGETGNLIVTLSGLSPWNITYNDGVSDVTVMANSSPYNLAVAPSATTSYTLSALTDANCTSLTTDLSGTGTINVNSRPTGSISGDATICNGESTVLTFNLTGIGPWDITYNDGTSDVTVTAISNIYTLNVSPNVTTTYFISGLNDSQCSSQASDLSGTATITVNPIPTSVISGSNTICDGESTDISISLTGTAPWSVTYSDGSSDNTVVANASPLTISVNPNVNTTYTVTALSDANLCSAQGVDMTGSAIVIVNPRPTVVLSGDNSICLGESSDLIFTLTGTAPWNLVYNDGTTDNTISNILASPHNLTLSPSATITYSVMSLDDALCSSQAADLIGSATLTVNQVTANISVSAPSPGVSTICAGTSVTFNASATDGSGDYNYDFHLVRGVSDNSMQSSSSLTYTTTGLQDGDQVYVIVTDNSTTCTNSSASINMTVVSNPVPALNITSAGGSTICMASTVDFVASPGFDRYVFMRNGTDTLQDDISNTLSTDILQNSDKVSVIAYSGACFGSSTEITLNVYDLPTAGLSADKTTVCDSELVNFTASSSGSGPFTYQFFVNGTSEQGPLASNTFSWSSTNDFSVEVRVFDGNNCEVTSAPVDITISKPVAGLVADKTTICENEEIIFTASGGDNYEFFVNTNSVQGPNTSTEYTTSSLANNNIITVEVTDAYGCKASHTGITVTVNPVPVVSLTGSDLDNIICLNDEVTFTSTGGDVYEFFIDGNSVQGPNGTNTYATTNLNDGEKVSSLVSYSTTGCSTLSSDITMSVNSLPVATLNAAPSNTIISGTNVTFTASGGSEYEFSIDGIVVQARSNVDNYSSNSLSNNEVVTVDVYDGNDCMSSVTMTMTVLDGIVGHDVKSTSDIYCEGDGGVSVYLGGTPQDGITYELWRTSDNTQELPSIMYNSTSPTPVRWDNILGDDEYRIEAYYSSVPAGRLEMNNRVTITENPLPTVYSIIPTGSVTGCNGGLGHVISLDNSQTGVNYTLLLNGNSVETLAGTDGSQLDFSAQLGIGIYSVTSENASTGCAKDMSGTFEIVGDGSDVAFNLFAVNPADPLDPTDGRYCAGGTGVEIGLDGSLDNTVNYKLYLDGSDTGVSILGTNGVMSFGSVTAEGSYTVRVESSSGCQFPMAGNVDVSIVPNPTAFNVLAEKDGHYCAGEVGVKISVDNQEEGVAYILFFNSTTPLDTVVGTNVSGTPILFDGPFASEGTYTVEAVVSDVECSRSMNNSVQVVVDPLPIVYDAYNDDAQFCTGESTIIYINESEADVEYNWYEINNGVYGSVWQNGNGSRLDFEINSEGTYIIIGRKTDGVTSCESTMNNGPFVITEKQLPQQKFLAKDPASILDCANGLIIQVVSTEVGVSYTLVKYEGGVYYPANNIPSITGDGTDISFLPIVDTNDAVYTVQAVKNGCSLYFTDTVRVNILGVIEKQTVTGSGEICNGDPGVSFGLANTESGVTYELWKNGDSNFVESIIGDGNAITYSPVGEEGEYYVMGRSTSCDLEMANRVVLNVNPLPVSFPMFGSGQTCDVTNDGALLGLVGSEVNYNYTLQFDDGSGILDNLTVIPGHINNDSLKYQVYQEGTYTFFATTDKGCTSSMNSEVLVVEKTQPVDFNIVSLSSDTYCEGEDGIYVQLENNENNVTYQIIDENRIVISEIVGTNIDINTPEVIDFPQALAGGIYTVWASRGGDACVNQINNNKEIVINLASSPTVHNLIVDNAKVCGNISPVISLEDSEPERQYRLEADGIAVNDTLTSIAGEPISWNVTESVSGDVIYEVIAMSGSTCDLSMGMIDVTYNDIPSDFIVNTNDLIYCEGGDNIEVSIESTQQDVAYFLVDTIDIANVLDVLIGNGSDQTFTENIGKGGYTISALLYETGCKVLYNDTLEIKESLLPTVNRDVFCGSIDEPECTVEDALCINPTESDVNYQLYDSNGVLVDQLMGNGDKLCFKVIDKAGNYSIMAVSGNYPYCENSFDNGGLGSFEFGNKNFGSLVAFDDTLNITNNIQVDTISVRNNDNLVYVVAGESEVIPYTEGGYFNSDDPPYLVVDKYWKDYNVTINPESTNIRFRLLDIDKDGVEREVESVSNKYVGVYSMDTITGELTLNKIPGFYGKDKVQYVVSNIDEEFNKSIERKDTATVYVFVGNEMIAEQKSFIIPNAFSPNGDGINDYYVITGIEGNGITAEKSNLEVFNRWGTLVYRSKGIKYGQDKEWWDGKSTTANMVSIGSDLPNGTYFYVFSVEINEDGEVKTKEYNGYVELRR